MKGDCHSVLNGYFLDKTIATTTKIEKIILKNFPEVDQVVSRIGHEEFW
jgi:cobalt-zinc-cadmium resistance protein CzcA